MSRGHNAVQSDSVRESDLGVFVWEVKKILNAPAPTFLLLCQNKNGKRKFSLVSTAPLSGWNLLNISQKLPD